MTVASDKQKGEIKSKAENMIIYHIYAYCIAIGFTWLNLGVEYDFLDLFHPVIAGFQIVLLANRTIFSYSVVILYCANRGMTDLVNFLEICNTQLLGFEANVPAYMVSLAFTFMYIVLLLVAVYILLLNKGYYTSR